MNKRKQKIIVTLLIGLNLLIIWGNSALPGEVSGEISSGILAAFAEVLGQMIPGGELLLRKLAHFSEFACLGLLLSWRFLVLEDRFQFPMPLLCGVLAAMTDETIQVFVPDRGPSVIDVWIDAAGVFTGAVILLLGCKLMKKQRNHIGGNKT